MKYISCPEEIRPRPGHRERHNLGKFAKFAPSPPRARNASSVEAFPPPRQMSGLRPIPAIPCATLQVAPSARSRRSRSTASRRAAIAPSQLRRRQSRPRTIRGRPPGRLRARILEAGAGNEEEKEKCPRGSAPAFEKARSGQGNPRISLAQIWPGFAGLGSNLARFGLSLGLPGPTGPSAVRLSPPTLPSPASSATIGGGGRPQRPRRRWEWKR